MIYIPHASTARPRISNILLDNNVKNFDFGHSDYLSQTRGTQVDNHYSYFTGPL